MMRGGGLGLISLLLVSACGGGAVSSVPARGQQAAGTKIAASSPMMHLASEQDGPNRGPDGPVSPDERTAAIERLLAGLKDRYVFPDKGKAALTALRGRAKRGEYEKIATGHAFAKALSDHVNEVLHDAHFRVLYSAEKIPKDEQQGEPTEAERLRHEAVGQVLNGGLERVERLPGNIGYVEVRSFAFLDRGARAAAAAMDFLAETDALIIDLRRNGGGDPDMVLALCSYFFAKSVHVNDIYDRIKNETRQFWTTTSVPGRPYLGKDVYVLTSKRTGSGAEEFAYDLQQLKRATIVGDRTWGGAHPGEMLRLSDHLAAFIPTGRAINPVSKTNWEGTGITPDIAVPADDALRVAQIKALQKQLATVKDTDLQKGIEERLKELSAGAAGSKQ